MRDLPDLSIAMQGTGVDSITARIAGTLQDLRLDVSPRSAGATKALRNLAKAINLALQGDFLETRLEPVYQAARVRKGTVEILHREYIGLGDGILAEVGRAARSFVLTLRGPDPAAPKKAGAEGGIAPVSGILNLLARKLDLVQEFEDMVPTFVEQSLDRLESVRMIQNWHRDEWTIETRVVGLDVVITPVPAETVETEAEEKRPRKKAAKKAGARQAVAKKGPAKKGARKSARK